MTALRPEREGAPQGARQPAPYGQDVYGHGGAHERSEETMALRAPAVAGHDETMTLRAPVAVGDDETVALRRAELPAEAAHPAAAEGRAGAAGGVGQPPVTGGRAARRRAAQQAARRGGRRARRAPVPGATGTSDTARRPSAGGPSAARPLTRAEARRAARARKAGPGVMVSRMIGELFITIGVLMLLFVTYQLWWSNYIAHQIADREARKLQKQWAEHQDERAPGAFSPGKGFAILYIPKLDVKVPVAEGVSKHKVLDRGMVGHYGQGALKTGMPWDKKGNFALAGHRNTHGEPFRYINRLRPGDKIIVETQNAYFTYEMARILPQTPPSNTGVIGPVPPGSGFKEPGRYITLTTCTPEFTSTYRMIVWGKMVDERPRSEGKPDALVG